MDARTILGGGEEVFLEANVFESHAGKFEVKGELKIITQDGVHLLPASVHQRLMYHMGSKTKIEEKIVQQVISEIDAGLIEVKAGGALEAISTLIKATKVKLDVGSLKLGAENEIFEKNVYFTGAKKWYGKRNSSTDLTYDELVLPTIINANSIFADITHDTTIEAAKILVAEESRMSAGGNINLLHKKNIHIHDHIQKKSHFMKWNGGKLSLGGTKTVREHFYGTSPEMSIYHCGGNFFSYSEGQIHLLGAKIKGDDIYLIAQKGVKIEAAPYTQEQFISISESGVRIGFNAKQDSYSASAELFHTTDKTSITSLLYQASEIEANSKLIIESTGGALELISSKLKFNEADIKARELKVSTHQESHTTTHTSSSSSIGIHVGVQESLTKTIDRAGYLLAKNGHHWLDILDRGLNGYSLYKEVGAIAGDLKTLANAQDSMQALKNLNVVKYGVWINANHQEHGSHQTHSHSLDNEIQGGRLDIIVDKSATIEGIKCQVEELKLKAESLTVTTSKDTITKETYRANMSLTVPVSGNINNNASISAQETSSRAQLYHPDNMIIASGTMELDITKDAKISGVKFQAAKVLIRANNLILESLQDTLEKRMSGMSLSVSVNATGPSVSPGFEFGERSSRWTNAIGSIIGTQVVNIAIAQTLEITGGLIANATTDNQGTLTPQGTLEVSAAKIIAKTLHDYDDGQSFGLGLTLNRSVCPSGDFKYGVNASVKASFNEKSRDILPTITEGFITGVVEGELNRDQTGHITKTHRRGASIDADIPISDFVEFVQKCLAPQQYQAVPAAGDEPESAIFIEQEGDEEQDVNNQAQEKVQVILQETNKLLDEVGLIFINKQEEKKIDEISQEIDKHNKNLSPEAKYRLIKIAYILDKYKQGNNERERTLLTIPTLPIPITLPPTANMPFYPQGQIMSDVSAELSSNIKSNSSKIYDNIKFVTDIAKDPRSLESIVKLVAIAAKINDAISISQPQGLPEKVKNKDRVKEKHSKNFNPPADFVGMPDPDDFDFEPDDEEKKEDKKKEEKNFNPADSKNHNKVSIHPRFGKFYQINDKWYSKDRAGHGGSTWKRFTQENNQLIWEADLDEGGNIIHNKNKGNVGTVINMKDLRGIK